MHRIPKAAPARPPVAAPEKALRRSQPATPASGTGVEPLSAVQERAHDPRRSHSLARIAITAPASGRADGRSPAAGDGVVQAFRDRFRRREVPVSLLTDAQIEAYLGDPDRFGLSHDELQELLDEFSRRENETATNEDLRRELHSAAMDLENLPDVQAAHHEFRSSGREATARAGTGAQHPVAPPSLGFVVEGPADLLALNRTLREDSELYLIQQANEQLRLRGLPPVTTAEEAVSALSGKGDDAPRIPPRTASREVYFGEAQNPTLLTDKMHTQGARSEQLPALGTYAAVSDLVRWLREGARLTDEQIATLVIQRVQGLRLELLGDALTGLSAEVLESVEYYVSQVALLLFGTESSRSVENRLIAPMMLADVAAGRMSFDQLFEGAATREGGEYYASMKGAVGASRSHHEAMGTSPQSVYPGPPGSEMERAEHGRRLDAQLASHLANFDLLNRPSAEVARELGTFGEVFYTNAAPGVEESSTGTPFQPPAQGPSPAPTPGEIEYATGMLEYIRTALRTAPEGARTTVEWFRLEDAAARLERMRDPAERVHFLNFLRPAKSGFGVFIRLRGG